MKILNRALVIASAILLTTNMVSAQFSQTPLPYAYGAFEGTIDAQTMEIHYSKHAATYTANLNKAIAGTPLEKQDLKTILSSISGQSAAVRNNAGGHFNHELFWTVLTPEKGTQPSAALLAAITKAFGSLDGLKTKLNEAATTRFGSGWAWLSIDSKGGLFISSTPNQDNPLMDVAEQRGTPIFGIDVWEHAYYLKYQNKRADYLSALWDIVNWKEVSNRYESALKK